MGLYYHKIIIIYASESRKKSNSNVRSIPGHLRDKRTSQSLWVGGLNPSTGTHYHLCRRGRRYSRKIMKTQSYGNARA